jgi:hypothetical protein
VKTTTAINAVVTKKINKNPAIENRSSASLKIGK